MSVIPYADFTYFGLLLYAVVPTLILGLFGKAGWRWATLVTAAMLIVQFHGSLDIRPHFAVREIWIVIGFAVWQWATVCVFAKSGARPGWPFYVVVAAGLLPLAASKFFPIVSPKGEFGFLGISYITFRALDVVFCLRDKVIALPGRSISRCSFFSSQPFQPARLTGSNASRANGERGEPALNFLSISTARCIAFFEGSFTNSSLPR